MLPTTDLRTFHDDLRAAVRAGVALELGDKPTPGSSLGIKELEQLETQSANSEQVPARYEAAIETWQATGSMIPVLEGLSARKKAWSRIGRVFRNAFLYVSLVAILAIVALAYYQLKILPEIEAVRQDLVSLADPMQEISSSNAMLFSNVALVLFVCMLLALIWWMLTGGIGKAGRLIGGSAFLRCQTLASACRTMQLLITKGVEPSRAAQLSGTLAGLDQEGLGELLYTIEGLDEDELQSPALADYLLMIADQQLITTRTWGPGVLILVVGGIFTILYALLAYGPIAALLYDLSRATRL